MNTCEDLLISTNSNNIHHITSSGISELQLAKNIHHTLDTLHKSVHNMLDSVLFGYELNDDWIGTELRLPWRIEPQFFNILLQGVIVILLTMVVALTFSNLRVYNLYLIQSTEVERSQHKLKVLEQRLAAMQEFVGNPLANDRPSTSDHTVAPSHLGTTSWRVSEHSDSRVAEPNLTLLRHRTNIIPGSKTSSVGRQRRKSATVSSTLQRRSTSIEHKGSRAKLAAPNWLHEEVSGSELFPVMEPSRSLPSNRAPSNDFEANRVADDNEAGMENHSTRRDAHAQQTNQVGSPHGSKRKLTLSDILSTDLLLTRKSHGGVDGDVESDTSSL